MGAEGAGGVVDAIASCSNVSAVGRLEVASPDLGSPSIGCWPSTGDAMAAGAGKASVIATTAGNSSSIPPP